MAGHWWKHAAATATAAAAQRHPAHLRVIIVEVGEVDQRLSHGLVLCDHLRVLLNLAHHVAVVILHHQHLWRGTGCKW